MKSIKNYIWPLTLTILGVFIIITAFLLMSFANTQYPEKYSDSNFNIMSQDIETVVCSVKNKTTMSQEDVEKFYGLSVRLDTYEGTKDQQVNKISDIIKNIADNWSATVGIDLGPDNAKMLTELCESAKQPVN